MTAGPIELAMEAFSWNIFLTRVKASNKLTLTNWTFRGSLAQKEANKGQNH